MEVWKFGYIGFLGFSGLLGFVMHPSFFSLFSLFSLFTLFQSKPQPFDFLLQKFPETVMKPVESHWSIRILQPNRVIEKCIVLCDGVQCPWWDRNEPYYERTIVKGGGGNVRLPKGLEKENAEITIKNGKKTLKKIKFKDIIQTHP